MNRIFTNRIVLQASRFDFLRKIRLAIIPYSLFLLAFFPSSAQPYENSWINYSQDYFKIKIWQDGIYRITSSSGLPLGSWYAPNIQIWYNGVEQYIYVYDTAPLGVISGNDYIEFYGQKNDGSLDTKMYANPAWQPNPNFSLITDTSIYFITYSLGTPGKRLTLETDSSYNSFTKANYFIKESYLEENSSYNVGGPNDQSIDYINAEGWVGTIIADGATVPKSIGTDRIFSGGPNVDINMTVVGSNNNTHQLLITGPGGINNSDNFVGYQVRKYNFSIPASSLLSPTSAFSFASIHLAGNSDRMSFVNLSVKYPHTMDLEGASTFKMYVPDGPGGKTRMDLTNFNGNSLVLYDITNHKRIKVSGNGSAAQTLIPNDGNSSSKFCYLADSALIPKITSGMVSRINYVATSGISQFNNLLNIAKDSAYIIITHASLKNSVMAANIGYKDYRDKTTGGKVVVVDVEELYDQFAYGQKNHGLGIKNFLHFVLDNWAVAYPPQAVFLIGKSIKPKDIRFNPGSWGKCLVASYGYPASDNLLAAGINGAINEPVIPIGRLSAKTGPEVDDYLNKVQDYELAQTKKPEDWMKEVLHFGGGSNPYEQNLFRGYLRQLESIIRDTSYGGHVTSYFKNSAVPIQLNLSKTLQAQINNGVSMMMFFGHASGQSFDISTDDPTNYSNYQRYPIVMASSCFAGDFHTDITSAGLSSSEKFVLTPKKAAIAFLASVGEGDAYYLYKYDTSLYNNISFRNYGAPVGKIIQQTIKSLQTAEPNTEGVKQVCTEMSLQGDPILKYNSWALPDYVAVDKNISFTPSLVKTDLDTFSIHFVTRNYGKAVNDSFPVLIKRTLPDGTSTVDTVMRARCFYGDTLSLSLKAGGVNGGGVNNFNIRVDLDPDRVHEVDDFTNNETNSGLFVYSSDVIPVYPSKYAIHPYSTVTLKASTSNPFGPVRNYVFEIDTVFFNDFASTKTSNFRTGVVSSSGGVISWSPANYTLNDSTIYHWRVYDDTATIYKSESSFTYIKNKTGWSQADFFQFRNDGYANVERDSVNRKYNFGLNTKALDIYNYGDPYVGKNADATGYYLNGVVQEYNGGCGSFPPVPFIHVAVIDSLTLEPWTNCMDDHGQQNQCGVCRGRAEGYFVYKLNDALQMKRMKEFVDSIPKGHYVIIYTWKTGTYSTNADISQMFDSLGLSTVFLSLNDNMPFIVYVKKGVPSSELHSIGTSPTAYITMNTTLQNQWYKGNIVSEIIGPAKQWTSLHWYEHKVEGGVSKDSITLNLYGLAQATGKWDTLMRDIHITTIDTSLVTINAVQYPMLKLEAFLEDDSLRTPPQLDKWQIYYDEVPECGLNANRHFTFHNNPLSEGDTLRMSMAIDNIGNLPMDSLGVSFYMYDKQHKRHDLKSYKLDSLRVGQFINADLTIDTTFGYSGQNSVWIEANPFGTLHQTEQTHINNVAEVKFNINRDAINPILDVTFDAVHILDGDIVSGKPHITIQLHDENKFLALNDTSNFRIYLKSPSQQQKQQLNFQTSFYGANMRFSPAALPKNSCRIDFDPILAEDGIYELEAEATDRSLNESGKYNYRISFEVINKSTITEVLNYPNPFTTSTRFAFVLTGSEVPAHMRIRIMTVTGKVIREIMKSELGNIHIGRNITDYAWDGRDEYGDLVANGVYLYRVDTDLKNGDKIEHRETEVDKYFKKGWGKMYLMR